MSSLISVQVNTGSFVFGAVASNETQAKSLLLEAYERHCQQVKEADPVLMSELLADGEMEVYTITPGVVTRDGSRILYRRPS